MRGSGRSASFTWIVLEAEVAVDREGEPVEVHALRGDLRLGVQKMWPSSCVKARTRMIPCSAPEGSLRWQAPNSP